MNQKQIRAAVEAMLFASGDPIGADKLAQAVQLPQLSVITANIQPVHMAIMEGEQEIFFTEQPALAENFNGVPLWIRPQSFFQTNPTVASALYATARDWVRALNIHHMWDLFCGVGTFSYPLSALPGTRIFAADSSVALLDGFRRSINKNMIANVEIVVKNLFKYPLDTSELKGFAAVVFDPPRAGAEAQAAQLAALPEADRPAKIIAVSCNPHSFVRDANILLSGGYKLAEVTIVDQFVYSNHSELVALFTK